MYPVDESCRVVLCAGAIESSCILQRSGVGKYDSLKNVWENLGITQKLELPVGESLYDHGAVSLTYMSKKYLAEIERLKLIEAEQKAEEERKKKKRRKRKKKRRKRKKKQERKQKRKKRKQKRKKRKQKRRKVVLENVTYSYYWKDIEPIFSSYKWRHSFLTSYSSVKNRASSIYGRISGRYGGTRMPPGYAGYDKLPQTDIDKFKKWMDDDCPYSKSDPRVNRITRTTGPSWTRGEMERPEGTKDMGSWTLLLFIQKNSKKD